MLRLVPRPAPSQRPDAHDGHRFSFEKVEEDAFRLMESKREGVLKPLVTFG
jgi:hypothetical protein